MDIKNFIVENVEAINHTLEINGINVADVLSIIPHFESVGFKHLNEKRVEGYEVFYINRMQI